MNVERIRQLISEKSGETPSSLDGQALSRFGAVAENNTVLEYLAACVPKRDYSASGLRVLSYEGLVRENLEDASPGKFIFPYGYLIVAISVGGNALCLDSTGGRVVWANHDSFFDGLITYKDERGEWKELLEYSSQNVACALRLVSSDIERFLHGLLSGAEEQRLDAFDLG